MDKPQGTRTAYHAYEELHHAGHLLGQHSTACLHVDEAQHPANDEQAERGGHEQLTCTLPAKLPCCTMLQGITARHACKQEHQGHEPRIEYRPHNILPLMLGKATDAAKDTLRIEVIEHVVDEYQHHGHPAQIIDKVIALSIVHCSHSKYHLKH